jgi:hypothetical protein
MNELNYTIESSDEERYSFISTCLESPQTKYSKLTVIGMTTMCSIVVLSKNDYLEIENEKITISKDYTNLNPTSLAELLTEMLTEIYVDVDETNRLHFTSAEEFEITGASYNMKQITGMYNSKFPLKSDSSGAIKIQSVGFYLSTPILYLLSNLGASCFKNKDRKYFDQKIVMRINNSFNANFPIVCNNAEFVALVRSNSLTDVWFKLVDANLQEIKLLSPMYIFAIGEGVPDEIRINTELIFEPKLIEKQLIET